jgi:hypothetical protein
MLRTEAAVKVSVRPRLVEVVIRVAGAGIVAYPFIVGDVDVGNRRVTLLVRNFQVIPSGGGWLPGLCGSRHGYKPRSPRGRRRGPASRNVSAADLRGAASAGLSAPAFILRKDRDAHQHCHPYDLFHVSFHSTRIFDELHFAHPALACVAPIDSSG